MLSISKLSRSEWSGLSENVHKYSFGVERPPDMDRIDYALVVRKDEEELCGYATIIELDAESAYMQHGGNFEASRGSTLTLKTYLSIIEFLSRNYKNVSTRIFNQNRAMIKLALTAGFLICGVDVSREGKVYLVLELEH